MPWSVVVEALAAAPGYSITNMQQTTSFAPNSFDVHLTNFGYFAFPRALDALKGTKPCSSQLDWLKTNRRSKRRTGSSFLAG